MTSKAADWSITIIAPTILSVRISTAFSLSSVRVKVDERPGSPPWSDCETSLLRIRNLII